MSAIALTAAHLTSMKLQSLQHNNTHQHAHSVCPMQCINHSVQSVVYYSLSILIQYIYSAYSSSIFTQYTHPVYSLSIFIWYIHSVYSSVYYSQYAHSVHYLVCSLAHSVHYLRSILPHSLSIFPEDFAIAGEMPVPL